MEKEVTTDIMKSEISVIEQNHHSEILAIHSNMKELIDNCNSIEISEDDKETYDKAVELKRVVKATHVAIEKKRKELKQPLIDYGKRLDRWVEEIYNPLVQAEKVVKKKMEKYELKLEKIKEEKKLQDEQKKAQEDILNNRLKNLNSQLEKINLAKNKSELKEIEIYLDSIQLSDFGDKSNEAGFILNQLKMTCSMASRLMKEEEVIEPIITPKIESTPITDDFLNELKGMAIEPAKKVVIKEEIKENIQEEIKENIQEDVKEQEQEVSQNNEEVFIQTTLPIDEDENINSSNSQSPKEINLENAESDSEPKKLNTEINLDKPSDDDILEVLDYISSDMINQVTSFINENTEIILEDLKNRVSFDFSEHKELILIEVRKRVGVLLYK